MYKIRNYLTGKWIDANGGTHFLKLDSELGILSYFLFMFAGKLLQVRLKGLDLFGHLKILNNISLIIGLYISSYIFDIFGSP